MKLRLLLLTLLAFITAQFAFRLKMNTPSHVAASLEKYTLKKIIRCGPDWEKLSEWLEETDIPLIPGSGNYQWKISTKSDSAQIYFNQGINMYYSFHIIESMASFKKGARFDPDCGMLQWAQALTYGPNINDLSYTAFPDALSAISKAIALSASCTEKERMLIKAQSVRYSADSSESRQKLNQLYVDAMKVVYTAYPEDADVAALYADALMLQHPWDLWNNDGTPKPWTPLIRNVLEKSLTKTTNNPGTNHYYIHVMEPSPYADKALPNADRLGKLTPGLSHTVHMPSHIYLRTGNYDKGVIVNENAVTSYKKTIPLYAPVTGADFLYIIHNLHMQTNNAMLGGRSAYSVQSAMETVNRIPKDYLSISGALGNYVQYVYMTPVLVNIRFGRWDALLNYPQPAAAQVYSTILYHFGRGMAFSYKHTFTEASRELALMKECMKDSSLRIPLSPWSAAIEGASVAEHLLKGSIHEQRKLYDEAIQDFRQADSIEANMVYNEPRDWILSPKHYLGNAYLQAGQFANAQKTFLNDLKNNKENGWALHGLYQSLTGEKRKAEARKVLERFKKAFEKTDVKIRGSVL